MTKLSTNLIVFIAAMLLAACTTPAPSGGGGSGSGASTPTSAGTFDDYLAALAQRESGGNAAIENTYGYLGLYQMGEMALTDSNWYKETPAAWANDWTGSWLADAQAYSVTSKDTFLGNVPGQDSAIRTYCDRIWGYIKYFDLHNFEGDTINGIEITRSGLIAGSHLTGIGTLKNYLESNGTDVPSDAYGTTIEEYLTLFAGYDTPYTP